MRYHLQRVPSNTWLTRDLEVRGGATTLALSGPGQVSGTVDAFTASRRMGDGRRLLDRWSTAIYAEDEGNGQIVGAGIVERISRTRDGGFGFEAPGFSRYPTGIPFDTVKSFGVRADPLDVFRYLWAYVQSFPDGNLGVVVDPTKSTATVGTNEEPYGLSWWQTLDCGGEMNTLAGSTPFDYVETHAWTSRDKSAVSHRVRLGTPRIGTARPMLRLVEDENVIIPVDITEDDYANEVMGVGAGEGSKAIRRRTATANTGRLRRPKVYTDKTANQQRLDALINLQLQRLMTRLDISQVIVRDHPNARLGALGLGDDLPLTVVNDDQSVETTQVRILGIDRVDETDLATLAVAPSSSFNYSTTFAEGVEYDSA